MSCVPRQNPNKTTRDFFFRFIFTFMFRKITETEGDYFSRGRQTRFPLCRPDGHFKVSDEALELENRSDLIEEYSLTDLLMWNAGQNKHVHEQSSMTCQWTCVSWQESNNYFQSILLNDIFTQGGQHFSFSKFPDFSLTFPENFPWLWSSRATLKYINRHSH